MKNTARITLLFIGDIAMLTAAFFAMLGIAFPGDFEMQFHVHVVPFAILAAIWLLIFFIFNLYDTQFVKPTIPHLRQVSVAFILAGVIGVAFFYAVPGLGITPRTNLAMFTVAGFIFFLFWRRIFYSIFSVYFKKTIIFITAGADDIRHRDDLMTYIERYPQSGFTILGAYNSVREFLSAYVQKTRPDVCIVSHELLRDGNNFAELYRSRSQIVDLAYAYEDILGKIPLESINYHWFLHNLHEARAVGYEFFKRVISVVIAGLGLLIMSPILLIAILLVYLQDRQPVFYHQTRVGKNGVPFELYKIRSMIVNAEATGAQWSSGTNDSRVTTIGKILRKTHIDELPQLWNVIRGDISLIGPRPERPEFVQQLEQEIPYYHLRHIIRPGFTGWAQIKFRYARSVDDSKIKFEYDLYYIKNRNIFMDLGIIARTVQIIFSH